MSSGLKIESRFTPFPRLLRREADLKKYFEFSVIIMACISISACAHYRKRTVDDLISYGVHLARLGCWDEASIHWKLALKADPDNVAALNNLAVAAEVNNDLKEAKLLLSKTVEIQPDNAAAKKNWRGLKQHMERYQTRKTGEEVEN